MIISISLYHLSGNHSSRNSRTAYFSEIPLLAINTKGSFTSITIRFITVIFRMSISMVLESKSTSILILSIKVDLKEVIKLGSLLFIGMNSDMKDIWTRGSIMAKGNCKLKFRYIQGHFILGKDMEKESNIFSNQGLNWSVISSKTNSLIRMVVPQLYPISQGSNQDSKIIKNSPKSTMSDNSLIGKHQKAKIWKIGLIFDTS